MAAYPKSRQVECDNGAPVDAVEETVAAGGSGLQYDPPMQQYTYVWKTEKAYAGTCRKFVLGLNDSSNHTALLRFK